MADDQVLRRNNMSQKRKTRNAIEVLDKMIKAGEVEKLWRDFHMNLKSAREQTVCRSSISESQVGHASNFGLHLVYVSLKRDLRMLCIDHTHWLTLFVLYFIPFSVCVRYPLNFASASTESDIVRHRLRKHEMLGPLGSCYLRRLYTVAKQATGRSSNETSIQIKPTFRNLTRRLNPSSIFSSASIQTMKRRDEKHEIKKR